MIIPAHIAVLCEHFFSKGQALIVSVSFTFNTVDKINSERQKKKKSLKIVAFYTSGLSLLALYIERCG